MKLIEVTIHHWGRNHRERKFFSVRHAPYWSNWPHRGTIAILTHPLGLWLRWGNRAIAFNWIP